MKIFNNKKGIGIVSSIIGMTIASVIMIPISNFLVQQLKSTNTSSSIIQQNLIIENEWNRINTEKNETIFSKRNTTESRNIDMDNSLIDSSKYSVSVSYGNTYSESTSEETLIAMPVTITVSSTNSNVKPISKTGKVYTNDKIDYGLVQNNSNPQTIGVKYNEKMNSIEYYLNKTQVMKPPSDFANGNGYIKFNNGLIMQYGNVRNSYFDEDHLERTNFQIPFPHDCLVVLTSVEKYSGGRLTAYVHDYNKDYWNCLPGFSGDEGHGTYYWIAIGY